MQPVLCCSTWLCLHNQYPFLTSMTPVPRCTAWWFLSSPDSFSRPLKPIDSNTQGGWCTSARRVQVTLFVTSIWLPPWSFRQTLLAVSMQSAAPPAGPFFSHISTLLLFLHTICWSRRISLLIHSDTVVPFLKYDFLLHRFLNVSYYIFLPAPALPPADLDNPDKRAYRQFHVLSLTKLSIPS